jgi:hypothetical protein
LNSSTVQWIGFFLVALSTLGFEHLFLGIFGIGWLSMICLVTTVIAAGVSTLLLIIF